MRAWRNGRRSGLKIHRRSPCRFESDRPHHHRRGYYATVRQNCRTPPPTVGSTLAGSINSVSTATYDGGKFESVSLKWLSHAQLALSRHPPNWLRGHRYSSKPALVRRPLHSQSAYVIAGDAPFACLQEAWTRRVRYYASTTMLRNFRFRWSCHPVQRLDRHL